MNTHVWLTFTKNGAVKMTKERPRLLPRQRAVRLSITIPDSAFLEPPDLDAQLDVPADRVTFPPPEPIAVEVWP